MATFKICIYQHQRRADGKFPVSIRVCWRRRYAYIKTEFYVTGDQINKRRFEVKDPFVIRELNARIAKYETIKSSKLGFRIESMTAKDLANYLEEEMKAGDGDVNFIEFGRSLADKRDQAGRSRTAQTYRRTLNAIVDFCNGRDNVLASEITAAFLERFAAYLKTERTLTRTDRNGKTYTYIKKGLGDVSVGDYMTDVRTIFNAAVDEFNDEDLDRIRIKHDPFRKYKIVKGTPKKRSLSDIQVRKILDVDLTNQNAIFAREVFALSFYLCGMNVADLYECAPPVVQEDGSRRIEYERKKTRNRREDRAFISIGIQPEAEPLIEKFKDPTGKRAFRFYMMYKYDANLSDAINQALKVVAEAAGVNVPLSMYYGRHAWASIARNKGGVSKDDIDLSLDHVDRDHNMADVYIDKDWTLIDKANRAVLDHINSLPDPFMIQESETPKSDDK